MPICSRCQRNLSAEKPVRLPDAREYCAACCESMATDAFEMETGEPFTKWIEKHPKLEMRYQPMELNVRRVQFFFPLVGAIGGVAIFVFGCVRFVQSGFSPLYLVGYALSLSLLAGLIYAYPRASVKSVLLVMWSMRMFSLGIPIASILGIFKFGRSAGLVVVGVVSVLLFGALAARGLLAYMRAQNFELTLESGVFHLTHGKRAETFGMDDLDRACVVRPGTIGATEGALGFKDGRMLTLDTCLSDLHALGVVMDLYFNREFPPGPEDIARERRTRLRKIRGLS